MEDIRRSCVCGVVLRVSGVTNSRPNALRGGKSPSGLPEDAPAYCTLVDRNRGHLTKHGDYLDFGEATLESVLEDLTDPENRNVRFGVWLDDQLIGRVDLNPRTAEDFVLGYWLGGEYTGKAYATAACAALITYGQEAWGARTIWAGVTKGNVKSEGCCGASASRRSRTREPARGAIAGSLRCCQGVAAACRC